MNLSFSLLAGLRPENAEQNRGKGITRQGEHPSFILLRRVKLLQDTEPSSCPFRGARLGLAF